MDVLRSKIIDYIKRNNSSVAEFEKRAGLSNASVGRLLSGRTGNPSTRTLVRISEVLGMSIDSLLSAEEGGAERHGRGASEKLDNRVLESVALHVIKFLNSAEGYKLRTIEQVTELLANLYDSHQGQSAELVNEKLVSLFAKRICED